MKYSLDKINVGYGGDRVEVFSSIPFIDFSKNPFVFYVGEGEKKLFDSFIEEERKISDTLVVLIKPNSPPLTECQSEGDVCSFVAFGRAAELAQELKGIREDKMVFNLVKRVMDSDEYIDLKIIHKLTAEKLMPSESERLRTHTIIPHLGDENHLKSCLKGLIKQTTKGKISVCLDQDNVPHFLLDGNFCREYGVNLKQINPNPSGPYVIRHLVASMEDAEIIVFHDSDDYSVKDRITYQSTFLRNSGADIVGCHELRLDEISERLTAFRFPLDVNKSLDIYPNHSQLFPTTIVCSRFFSKAGGFSTNRKIANDTQFLFRNHFLGRIINVDEFLYVRRKREGSLTTSPGIEIGSPIRENLLKQWKDDFVRVKSNLVSIEDCSLRIEHTSMRYTIRDLEVLDA